MDDYPNLPATEWIGRQTVVIGGEVLIIGLTQAQAEEVVRFAREKGAEGSGLNRIHIQTENPLTESERKSLSRHREVPEGSVEVYVGHTTECHKSLFRLLGIPS